MFEAEVVLSYGSARVAEAVADAVSPDNVDVPKGMTVRTARRGTKVLTKIVCGGTLLTFVATVDDLLSAASVAERSALAIKHST